MDCNPHILSMQCDTVTMKVNVEDIIFNGKHVGKEDEEIMMKILRYIDKQQTGQGYGFLDYTFDRGCMGWNGERTMSLGLEIQKLLYKLNAEKIAPHITIDIPVNEERSRYTTFYRGPDLEINEGRESVKITGLAHLNYTQVGEFVVEASKVYCKVMDVDYDEAAKEQL